MDINENGNVAFSKRRSEMLDFRAGLMRSTLCTNNKIKIAPGMGLSRDTASVCPDLGIGDESAKEIAYSPCKSV